MNEHLQLETFILFIKLFISILKINKREYLKYEKKF